MEKHCTIFAALADPIRLRSLALMAKEGELCVCELTHSLQIPQPRISKHLAALRETGLVAMRREAQWVLYSIAKDLPEWAEAALAATFAGLSGDPVHIADLRRLRKMPNRPAHTRAA